MRGKGAKSGSWQSYVVIFAVFYGAGYLLGYVSKDQMFTNAKLASNNVESGRRQLVTMTSSGASSSKVQTSSNPAQQLQSSNKKLDGYSIHSVMTSNGDHYQNYQARIMYASYKLVQKMPGGEHLTGFTRLLHRTVPDVLMNEIPTYIAMPVKPECDGWCDYPVANRPPAIQAFFEAAAKNRSMIQGAWVFMLETDYVWMQPMQPPGSSDDPKAPGVQFYYDYIGPQSPAVVPSMQKLYSGDVNDIPASGPSPVLMRLDDWIKVVPDYVAISKKIEADASIKKVLDWVREMYAWDVAVAMHKEVPMVTEKNFNSSTIIQPPFDDKLGRAAMCHYTWAPQYHDGIPSKGAKWFYRWEKRDFAELKYVLKVPAIPMPPAWREGLFLEFDAGLSLSRHNMIVKMLTQVNKAIETLPDLNDYYYKTFEPELKEIIRKRDEANAQAVKKP